MQRKVPTLYGCRQGISIHIDFRVFKLTSGYSNWLQGIQIDYRVFKLTTGYSN